MRAPRDRFAREAAPGNPLKRAIRPREPASATPVSDTVLANPLAIPPGVGQWLREWELRLRAALRDAETQATPRPSVPAWDEALAELRGLDPDAEGSVFRLLLLRPLWQLEEGSAARDTFERYVRTVLDRIDAARALMREIVPLRTDRDRLIEEFGTRFPNRLAEQLERVRAREVDIARLRRATDATRMRDRLARARIALERLAALAGPAGSDGARDARTDDERETIPEMVAALALAERERRQLVLHPVALRAHRRHLVAQLRGLARSAPASPDDAERAATRGHTAVVLEQLIHAAGAMEGAAVEGRDAPTWTGAVSAGVAAHHPGLERFAWLPALLAADDVDAQEEPPALTASDLLHVVPVGEGLLYLSPLPASSIRVYTRTVRLGESVECQVVSDLVPRHSAALVDADVSAIFDGLDAERSRWYSTTARARARVVARHGDGWFARLEQRGALSVVEQPAWHRDGPGAAFRLLRPASSRKHVESVSPVREEALSTFLGFTIRECRTGLRDDERGWVRGIVGGWPGAADAVAREVELFSQLHARAAGSKSASELALRPLTWVRVDGERDRAPLYRVPLATLDAPRRLRSWIVESDDHMLAVLGSVARIIEAAHAAGFALGVCHAEAFAYTLAWAPDPLTPQPAAILAHAPCATRLGEPFSPPGGGTGLAPAYYRMLRTPVLVPQVAAAQWATVERDMQGFGAFVLDLLLEHPIYERGTLDWYDAPAVVRARASQCSAHPTVAKYLGDLIQDPLGWRRLADMAGRLAGGRVRKVAELL